MVIPDSIGTPALDGFKISELKSVFHLPLLPSLLTLMTGRRTYGSH
jgi:hypothetical protein